MVRIAGAGLAGLSVAIGLARRGRRVLVYDRAADSGLARRGEWDAAENWTGPDLLSCLAEWGISSDFAHRPMTTMVAYDAAGNAQLVRVSRPYCHLIQRGPQPGGLEHALKEQALALGVDLRYGQAVAREAVDVWAVGCVGAGFFLGVGFSFRTSHSDVVLGALSRQSSPNAYSYLVIVDGQGTLSTLLTRDFANARRYLDMATARLQRYCPFDMEEPYFSTGYGGRLSAFLRPEPGAVAVGEAAGYQDYLWGFGIRHALLSGQLAAQALCDSSDDRLLDDAELRRLVEASLANRLAFDLAGDRAQAALIRFLAAATDLHGLTRRWYRGETPLHRLAVPIAVRRYRRGAGVRR